MLALLAAVAMIQDDPSPHSQGSLIKDFFGVNPGESVNIGVKIDLDPGWYAYWRNPGDSGEALTVEWELPKGWSASELKWPIPNRINSGGYTSYGYRSTFVLTTAVGIPSDAQLGEATIGARLKWLVCKDACIPARQSVSIRLNVQTGILAGGGPISEIIGALQKLPTAPKHWQIEATRKGNSIRVFVDPPKGVALVHGDFFPNDPETLNHSAVPTFKPVSGGYETQLEVSEFASKPIRRLRGVLVLPRGNRDKTYGEGVEIDVPVVEGK